MNVDAFLIGIGGELRKLRAIEYFNIAGMALPFWIFNEVSKKKKKNHFAKVVLLKKFGLFWGKSILSLELYIYKNMQQKYSCKPFIFWFCIFNSGCVMPQSLKYGGIYNSHFVYIQTTITALFLGRFWKILRQNKWLAKHFTPRHTYSLYCVPL